MQTNSAWDNWEAEWQDGYAMHISSVNACPMLDHLKTTICKTNSYIRHISNYNRIAE